MRDCCSFDGMVTADLDERYDNIGGNTSIGSGNGRNGTNGLHGLSPSSGFDKLNLPNHTTYGMAFSFLGRLALGVYSLCSFYDGTTKQCGVGVDATGKAFIWRVSTSTVIATTASQVIFNGVTHHIQFQATVNNTTGAYELRVDGTNVLSGTGANTRNSANNQANGYALMNLGVGSFATSATDFDDLYVWDGSGSINNTFPGDVRVFAVTANGAGNSAQFTPSTGSNYDCTNETTPNTTDYVSDSTVSHKDTYTFTDISGSGTVLGASLSIYAQKAAAGPTRGIQGICRSSTTEAVTSEAILGQSWRYWIQGVFETDPNTSAAWASLSALNNAEFGVKVST